MERSERHMEWAEAKIKVPWGHIAGKWWGSQNVRPILALHGWQDNAGTFDTLIPLLSAHYSILAIDFPGHGRSSFLPEGMRYYNIDFVNVVVMIMKELKWNKISILGHSMGAVTGLWFAAMFPDKIDLLIAIDILKPPQASKERYWEETAQQISGSLLTDERNRRNNEPPCYSYNECVERLYAASESVDRSKCPYLLIRNIKKSTKYPGKYYFSRDGRLKFIDRGIWPQEIYIELAYKIRAPFLFINALDAPRNEPLENFRQTISVLRKNPLFEYREVRGRHHVHLNEPQNLCGIIEDFLSKYSVDSSNATRAKL